MNGQDKDVQFTQEYEIESIPIKPPRPRKKNTLKEVIERRKREQFEQDYLRWKRSQK